jgi:hypothetical protein
VDDDNSSTVTIISIDIITALVVITRGIFATPQSHPAPPTTYPTYYIRDQSNPAGWHQTRFLSNDGYSCVQYSSSVRNHNNAMVFMTSKIINYRMP